MFAKIPDFLPEELSETLIRSASLRIERIVSHGHASPADFWYEQHDHEWVVVLQGTARLQFEDEEIELKAGDFLNIPANRRHRVDWTTPDGATVWLAIFYAPDADTSRG